MKWPDRDSGRPVYLHNSLSIDILNVYRDRYRNY